MKGKSMFRFALLSVALLILLAITPFASAVRVNIVSNGATVDTIDIRPSDVVNWHIMEIHNASDITWSRVKISIFAISADSSKPIEKMYLYRCKAYGPLDCITKPTIPEPLEFTSYIDTELSWNDMSERVATTAFPQIGNLLLFVKLRGSREAWTGVFIRIERVRYDEFNIYNYDLEELDFYAKDLDLVQPIKKYIETYHMLPMEWSNGVVLKNAGEVYALAADEGSMQSAPINFRPEIPGSDINAVVNDFYFVFPTNINGVLNPITLNKNPTFTCGDGVCERDLGEISDTCCFDCGCPRGYYCDVADIESPQGGVCKASANISLSISGLFDKKITQCQDTTKLGFTAIIQNAPSSIQTPISGALEIEDFALPVECHGSVNALQCYTEFTTEFICGSFERDIEYKLTLPIEYNDGSNVVTKELVFSTIGSPQKLRYECKCDKEYFCDVEQQVCQPEDSIILTVLDSTQTLYEFDPTKNNTVYITAQIENAPANYTLLTTTYNLKEIGIEDRILPGSSGQLSCTLDEEAEEDNIYKCEFTLIIPNYDHEKEYIIRENEIRFKISYDDVGEHKTKKMSAIFSDILIPPYTCGDGICQALESSETCCLDCGCEEENVYCDIGKGCKSLDDIGLTVKASPTSFDDCLEQHTVKIKGQITSAPSSGSSNGEGLTGYGIVIEPLPQRANQNVPTGAQLDSYEHLEDGMISDYSISCGEINPVTGVFACELSIGPFDECKQPITIGPNELQIVISFPDGEDIVSKMLTASFGDITVNPVVHPGDGVCEEEQGETAATSCIDCPCEDDPQFGSDYYCDYSGKGAGTCKPKSSVKLIISKPDRDVYFESCNVSNELEIKAYIQNEPSGTYLEYARAILNGEAVDVYCYSDYPFFGGGGLQSVGGHGGGLTGWGIAIRPSCSSGRCGLRPSPKPREGDGGGLAARPSNMYTCTLTIPPEDECEEGKSFVYRGALQFFISYNNGKNRDAGVLSANLPQIFTNKQPPAGYGYAEGGEAAEARYAMLEEKMKAIEKMKKQVQSCEPGLGDQVVKAGKTAAVAVGSNVIVEAICLIPGVDLICNAGGREIGKAVLTTVGNSMVKSQKNKCDNLKAQLEKIKADYNAELSQTALQDCIMKVVEAYKNGECKSSVNIEQYASSPTFLERLLGVTGNILRITGMAGSNCPPCQKSRCTTFSCSCVADRSLDGEIDRCSEGQRCFNGQCVDDPCMPNPCGENGKIKKDCCGDGVIFECDAECQVTVESTGLSYECSECDPCEGVECPEPGVLDGDGETTDTNNGAATGESGTESSETSTKSYGSCQDGSCDHIITPSGLGAGLQCVDDQCVCTDCALCGCPDGYKCMRNGKCVKEATGMGCNKDTDCANIKGTPRCDPSTGRCVQCLNSDDCPEGKRCDLYIHICIEMPREDGRVDCAELLKKCYEQYGSLKEKYGTEMYKHEKEIEQGVIKISEDYQQVAQALGIEGEINLTALLERGIEWISGFFTGDTSDAEGELEADIEKTEGTTPPEGGGSEDGTEGQTGDEGSVNGGLEGETGNGGEETSEPPTSGGGGGTGDTDTYIL
jgi:hypothetical protein